VSLLTASATQMEDMVNALGYVYLGQKKLTQAIQVFQLNVSMYPNAWNVHDSLGEAYAEDGKKEEAIKSYSKSIELNPKNTAGIDRLKKLREQ
ncbi:MAG: tetratricopeptide repeat protein, partial [Chitinophagaceae bacterium]